MTKNRRRSRQGGGEPLPEARIAKREHDEPAATAPAGRSRRRSHRVDEALSDQPPPGVPGSLSGQPPPGVIGSLSGQLPSGVIGSLSGQLPPGVAGGCGLVVSDAGRYLRQAARDDAPTRFGSPAGEVDESARRVWEIAFGLVVRRRFEPDSALAEISRTVATAVHDHAAAGLAILDAEMLVRAALGETVPVGDLDEGVRVAVHLLLFASLADELALGDAELDAIIAEAEAEASALMAV